MRIVLQTDDIKLGCGGALVGNGNAAGGQQPLGLQLLATQAHHHHLATEVGIQADVAQRADGNDCVGRVDGNAAAVTVFERNHVVHIGKARQQLGLDALHRKTGDTGHALHGLRDGQDVARADRAVRIAVALEGVALQWWQRLGLHGRHGQVVEAARIGHLQQALVHPAAGGDVGQRMADGHAVAQHHRALRQIHQRHLVALRHLVAQHQAAGQFGPGRQTAVVGDDGHVVAGVHADGQRCDRARHRRCCERCLEGLRHPCLLSFRGFNVHRQPFRHTIIVRLVPVPFQAQLSLK